MTELEIFNVICSASPSVAILVVWLKMSARLDILAARVSFMSDKVNKLENIILSGGGHV